MPYADIADPQTINKYAYVRNNPMRYTDPNGHCVDTLTCSIEGVEGGTLVAGPVGAVIGGIIGAVAGPAVAVFVAEGLDRNPTAAGSIVGAHAYLAKPAQATGNEGQAQRGQDQQSTAGDPNGENPRGPVKAKDSPGVTAGGQATDRYGNKLGPSGKPQVNKPYSNTRESAHNKALKEGSGAVDHHNPKEGNDHICTLRIDLERRGRIAHIMSSPNSKVSSGNPKIWIGMVEVCADSQSQILGDADGAFVNVLTWAVDSGQFKVKANELMQHLHLRVVAIEDAEPLEIRGAHSQLDEEIGRIADEVFTNPESIRYGTFHLWKSGGDD